MRGGAIVVLLMTCPFQFFAWAPFTPGVVGVGKSADWKDSERNFIDRAQ